MYEKLLFDLVLNAVLPCFRGGNNPGALFANNTASSYESLTSAQTGFGLRFFMEIFKEYPNENLLVTPLIATEALQMGL